MRLAYLTSRYPAVSHTFIRREVTALRRRGAEIHTFSVRSPPADELLSELARREHANTWYVLPVSPVRLLISHTGAFVRRPRAYLGTFALALRHRVPGIRSLLWGLFYFAEAIVLAAELERRGIRHVHNHFAHGAATVGLLATRYLGIGWSLTLHGTCDYEYPAGPILGAKIAAARFTACVSHFGRAQALRAADPQHWAKLFVYRCGVDLTELPSPTQRRGPDEYLQVLCVGRLSPEKCHVGLIDAFVAALKGGTDASLRIIGDGAERDRIERRIAELAIAERCSLVGSLPEEAVLREIAASDVLVLSSLMEGLPVVLMEAMALGVPVIAPRLAGIPELVVDGQNGLLYSPTRWDELADCLGRLARDPEYRRRLGVEGRRRVETEFNLEHAIEPLWERFEKLELAEGRVECAPRK